MKFVGTIASFLLGASLSLPSSIYAFQAPSLLSSSSSSSLSRNGERLRLSSTVAKKPGTAELDTPWEELGFEFRPTNSHVRITCKDGEWGQPELVKVRYSKFPSHSFFGEKSFLFFFLFRFFKRKRKEKR